MLVLRVLSPLTLKTLSAQHGRDTWTIRWITARVRTDHYLHGFAVWDLHGPGPQASAEGSGGAALAGSPHGSFQEPRSAPAAGLAGPRSSPGRGARQGSSPSGASPGGNRAR